jgi:hypothetical protein
VANVAAARLRVGLSVARHAHHLVGRWYLDHTAALDEEQRHASARVRLSDDDDTRIERDDPGSRRVELDIPDVHRSCDDHDGGGGASASRPDPADTRELDEHALHCRERHVEYRMGIPVHAGAGFGALAPSLRLPVRWEGGHNSCCGREWGFGPFGDDASERRKPSAPGERAGELHLDRQGHRGAINEPVAVARGYASGADNGSCVTVSAGSRANSSSSSAK